VGGDRSANAFAVMRTGTFTKCGLEGPAGKAVNYNSEIVQH
jgi:hypothetical protein